MRNYYTQRMTKQRMVILDTLKSVKTHPTADELFDAVRKKLPRISLGTVYRNLEIMSGMGVIIKIDIDGSPRRYDGNPEKHYHLRCLGCGKVIDIPGYAVGEITVSDDYGEGFKVVDYCLHFVGMCGNCAVNAENTVAEEKLFSEPV